MKYLAACHVILWKKLQRALRHMISNLEQNTEVKEVHEQAEKPVEVHP